MGFCKGVVECECEGCGSEWTTHGYSSVCVVGLGGVVIEAAVISGVCGDPGSYQWFILGVVLLYRL